MNAEKVQEVIDTYRKKFNELGISKKDYPHDEYLDYSERGLEHCYAMLDKMEGFIVEDRMDKVYRWLGFIQGCFWSRRIYTLAELTDHNRKDLE